MIKVFKNLFERKTLFPNYEGEFVYSCDEPFDKQDIYIKGNFRQRSYGYVVFCLKKQTEAV